MRDLAALGNSLAESGGRSPRRFPCDAEFLRRLPCLRMALVLLALAPAAAALAQQDAQSPAEPSPVEPPALELLEPDPGIAGDSDGVDTDVQDSAPTGSPRTRYNLALEEFGDGAIESAVDGFLAARDEAGADVDLRYRSAFNLGVALAARADAEQAEEPERPSRRCARARPGSTMQSGWRRRRTTTPASISRSCCAGSSNSPIN